MNCTPFRAIKPPQAERINHLVHFGNLKDQNVGDVSKAMDPPQSVPDNYFWLRDASRSDKKVLKHLRNENRYTSFKTKGIKSVAHKIYKELLSYVGETDSSVPAKHGNYMYYSRTVKGKGYEIHCRKPLSGSGCGKEQIILDENILAKGKKYCDVSELKISPCHKIVAFAVDYTGEENYSICFRHIDSQKDLPEDTLNNTSGSFEWGMNKNSIYYCTMDETQRPNKLWRHYLKTVVSDVGALSYGAFDVGMDDVRLFEEKDELFNIHVSKSRSGRFLFLTTASSTSCEQRFVDLKELSLGKKENLELISAREEKVVYFTAHATENKFLILTNANGASNFTIMSSRVGGKKCEWKEFTLYDSAKSMLSLECFKKFSLIEGRENGLPCIWVIPDHDPDKIHKLDVFEKLCDVEVDENYEYDSVKFRYAFSTLTTPQQTWEFNVETKERIMLKQEIVPNYHRENYESKRLFATAGDGTKIPITMVWNKTAIQPQNKPNFVHMYGYGSYQVPIELNFSAELLPLINRGVIFAIAHVRGGGEYGREWYEQARFENKKRTFDDFIVCAKHLIQEKYTQEQLISIEGHSAGGLLVGAVVNAEPNLFRACLAGVPFVDVLNSMSDSSIPLTTSEWLEWGNPHQRKSFEAIKNYCPYQNVGLNAYPAILATAGFYDNRVSYSEAAKWIAKLRQESLESRDMLLKIDMNSGHFTDTNKYSSMKERSFQLAWVLSELGVLQLNKKKQESQNSRRIENMLSFRRSFFRKA